MNARLTQHLWLAFGAFLIAAAAALWISRQADPDQDEWSRAMPELQSGSVQRLEIETGNSRWVFQRAGASWVGEDDEALTSPERVEGLVSSLVYLETGSDLGVQPSAEYGLEPPLHMLRLHLQDGTIFRIDIGEQSTDQMHDYVYIDGRIRLSRTRISLTIEQLLESLIRPEAAP